MMSKPVWHSESAFFVAAEEKWEALAALTGWARHELGRGRSWDGYQALINATTLEDALPLLHWVPTTDEQGNIIGLTYAHASYYPLATGAFSAMAPYVRAGSYLLLQTVDFTDQSQGRGYVEASIAFDGADARDALRVVIPRGDEYRG